jgi:hypothetical protein
LRTLSANLQTALSRAVRRPAYKLYAYDPAVDTLSAIVLGEATQAPYDLTPFAGSINWTPAKIDFTLTDPDGRFYPDYGAQRRYLADKAIIRLREGDAGIPEEEWPWTFTGQIRGQIGWTRNRRTQDQSAKVSVFSRENAQAMNRRQITSKAYTKGTELGIFLQDLCTTFLGITPGENRLPSALGLQLLHLTNQVAQISPWEAVQKLLETVGLLPYCDGEGKLTAINKNLKRPPDRILADYTQIKEYGVPERNQDTINYVRITTLDSELSRVDGVYQKLGTAQVTTGFFSMHEKLPCWWSDDHRQRAAGTTMKVIKSVNSGILPVGTERYEEKDEFHGEIHVDIAVWVPILATVMLLEYLSAALIPDKVAPGQPVQTDVVTGTGITLPFGITISWGRILQAQAMGAIMLIMMSIGSAQYEIWGTPFDYAYLDLEARAIEDGLQYWEENRLEIRNDFLGNQDRADALALLELTWQKSLSLPRRLSLNDDLALEPGDIVQLPDGRKFLAQNLSKTLKRGEAAQLTLDGFKVMTA